MWIKKEDHKSNVAHISLKFFMEGIWYLDSGFSKYTAGEVHGISKLDKTVKTVCVVLCIFLM
jgi:hypothetical protein